VRNKKSRLGGVENSLGGIHKFAYLQGGSPHCALPSGYCGIAVAVVKYFVSDKCTAETKEPKFDATDVNAPSGGFIEKVEVIDGIGTGAKLFDDNYVFAGAPDGVHWDIQFDLT
jgi:hypothetical protein